MVGSSLLIFQTLYDIASQYKKPIVFSGGVAFNKIIKEFLQKKGVIFNKEVSCGDPGISFGQLGALF